VYMEANESELSNSDLYILALISVSLREEIQYYNSVNL
jgi:hypothetical protein